MSGSKIRTKESAVNVSLSCNILVTEPRIDTKTGERFWTDKYSCPNCYHSYHFHHD